MPDYKKHGRKVASLERNKQIVENAGMVIAFWDGISKGTKFSTDCAKKSEKK